MSDSAQKLCRGVGPNRSPCAAAERRSGGDQGSSSGVARRGTRYRDVGGGVGGRREGGRRTEAAVRCEGGVAQLGERVNGIHEVRGSIPLASILET
jgi:hypothetical protein